MENHKPTPPRLLAVVPDNLSVHKIDFLRTQIRGVERGEDRILDLPPGVAIFQLVDGRWSAFPGERERV